MFKKLLITGVCLLLTACNMPSGASPTPDVDAIGTQVSTILTESPVFTLTLPPATVIPENPTAEPTALEPSHTPTLTETVTPSPTNAGIPSGDPSWRDSLSTGASFGVSGEGYDDGNTRIFIQDDTLTLVSVNSSGWRGWRLASHRPGNYYLKADFRTETCSGSDQYGIITQSPDYETGFGYFFGLTCDGRYSIQRWNENGLSNLDGWNSSESINTGSEQVNVISILKTGDNFKYFVNDALLSEVNDNHFSEPGFFGPFIAGLATPNFTVRLNEIAYWTLP